MHPWWNWQTRMVQVHVPDEGVEVRILSGAPYNQIIQHCIDGAIMVKEREADENNVDSELESKVQSLLESQINPALAGHGGFVRLLKVEGSDVYLELGGGCKGCAGARATMRYGIESALRETIPNLGEVIDATDHSG